MTSTNGVKCRSAINPGMTNCSKWLFAGDHFQFERGSEMPTGSGESKWRTKKKMSDRTRGRCFPTFRGKTTVAKLIASGMTKHSFIGNQSSHWWPINRDCSSKRDYRDCASMTRIPNRTEILTHLRPDWKHDRQSEAKPPPGRAASSSSSSSSSSRNFSSGLPFIRDFSFFRCGDFYFFFRF